MIVKVEKNVLKIHGNGEEPQLDYTACDIYDNVKEVCPVTYIDKTQSIHCVMTKQFNAFFHNSLSNPMGQSPLYYNENEIDDGITIYVMNDQGKTIETYRMRPKKCRMD